MSIRIVVADDHKLVRDGLSSLIEKQQGMEVVAETEDGRTTVQQVQKQSPTYDMEYYPSGPRMVVQIISTVNGNKPGYERLSEIVDYGEEGQVVFHRLDESFFIPNMFERDKAVRIAPTPTATEYGIRQDGVRNPTLLENNDNVVKTGLY